MSTFKASRAPDAMSEGWYSFWAGIIFGITAVMFLMPLTSWVFDACGIMVSDWILVIGFIVGVVTLIIAWLFDSEGVVYCLVPVTLVSFLGTSIGLSSSVPIAFGLAIIIILVGGAAQAVAECIVGWFVDDGVFIGGYFLACLLISVGRCFLFS